MNTFGNYLVEKEINSADYDKLVLHHKILYQALVASMDTQQDKYLSTLQAKQTAEDYFDLHDLQAGLTFLTSTETSLHDLYAFFRYDLGFVDDVAKRYARITYHENALAYVNENFFVAEDDEPSEDLDLVSSSEESDWVSSTDESELSFMDGGELLEEIGEIEESDEESQTLNSPQQRIADLLGIKKSELNRQVQQRFKENPESVFHVKKCMDIIHAKESTPQAIARAYLQLYTALSATGFMANQWNKPSDDELKKAAKQQFSDNQTAALSDDQNPPPWLVDAFKQSHPHQKLSQALKTLYSVESSEDDIKNVLQEIFRLSELQAIAAAPGILANNKEQLYRDLVEYLYPGGDEEVFKRVKDTIDFQEENGKFREHTQKELLEIYDFLTGNDLKCAEGVRRGLATFIQHPNFDDASFPLTLENIKNLDNELHSDFINNTSNATKHLSDKDTKIAKDDFFYQGRYSKNPQEAQAAQQHHAKQIKMIEESLDESAQNSWLTLNKPGLIGSAQHARYSEIIELWNEVKDMQLETMDQQGLLALSELSSSIHLMTEELERGIRLCEQRKQYLETLYEEIKPNQQSRNPSILRDQGQEQQIRDDSAKVYSLWEKPGKNHQELVKLQNLLTPLKKINKKIAKLAKKVSDYHQKNEKLETLLPCHYNSVDFKPNPDFETYGSRDEQLAKMLEDTFQAPPPVPQGSIAYVGRPINGEPNSQIRLHLTSVQSNGKDVRGAYSEDTSRLLSHGTIIFRDEQRPKGLNDFIRTIGLPKSFALASAAGDSKPITLKIKSGRYRAADVEFTAEDEAVVYYKLLTEKFNIEPARIHFYNPELKIENIKKRAENSADDTAARIDRHAHVQPDVATAVTAWKKTHTGKDVSDFVDKAKEITESVKDHRVEQWKAEEDLKEASEKPMSPSGRRS